MSLLDTLRAAFKGGAGPRVPLARSYVSPWSYPAWACEPAGTRPPFEYRSAVVRGFLENPVAQRAVRLVAEGVGGAPLAPADDAALALVTATSAGQSLLETLAAQILLHGNGYVQIRRDGDSKPTELFALRPERVSVIAGADGWPAAYQYKVGDTTLSLPVEGEGECWLVGDEPTGAWIAQAGALAALQAGSWIFAAPRDGMQVFDKLTGQLIFFRDGWQRPATPAAPSGGTTVDAEARAAIAGLVEALIAAGILAQD